MESEKFSDHTTHKAQSDLDDVDIAGPDQPLCPPDLDERYGEHKLTVQEALRAYPMAVFWCLVVSLCVIMEGYDSALLFNFYAYPSFQRRYGEFVGVSNTTRSGYQLTASWQAVLGNASGIGAFFGTLFNGYLVQRFGHRLILLGALGLLSCFICMTFWAPNLFVLCMGEFLCGLPWGVFATAAPAYASEVLPLALRVYFTSWTNMCFVIGQFITIGVLRSLATREDEWAYRIPFGLQWVWPVFLIPLVYFAPPSPYHEVRHGRLDSAEKSLRRLQRSSASINPKHTLATIVHTNNLEKDLSVGTSYLDCFTGFERRRTEIACVCFVGQILSGLAFACNSYFFEQLGFQTPAVYTLTLFGAGLSLAGTLFNWAFLMPYFGRRPVYIWGMFAMSMLCFLIAILNIWTAHTFVAATQASLSLLWMFIYQLSAGQLGWALPAEVGSTRLRQKTICLSRNAFYVAGVIAGCLQPFFMNPSAWNLKGYTGFVWGVTALLTFVWAYFRLPETRGRSYRDLDILFASGVGARAFESTDVDALVLGSDSEKPERSEHVHSHPSPRASESLDLDGGVGAGFRRNEKEVGWFQSLTSRLWSGARGYTSISRSVE